MMETATRTPTKPDVRLIDELGEVGGEVSRLRGVGVGVGFDIETTDTDAINSRIVALQFKPKGKQAVIIDVRLFPPEALRTLGSMLEPLFDGTVELIGQNLKFDLEFMAAQLGLAGHKAYDTQIAEQVILGMGWSSAYDHKIPLDLAAIGAKYGVEVHKEERSWFIRLDERDEWWLPFPDEQVQYMRQDVSVVHRIKEAQQAAIKEQGLEEAIALEMRALFPVAGVEYFGVQIEREGWLSVIDRVDAKAKELEAVLHLGKEGEFDGLDVHVLKVRSDKYMDKWKPYEEWKRAREAYVANRRAEWDEHPGSSFLLEEKPAKNWSEYKKLALEWYDGSHPKQKNPGPLKSGVNLGSHDQVRDGLSHLLGVDLPGTKEEDLVPHLNRHPLIGVYADFVHHKQILGMYGRERGKRDKSFIELLDSTNRLRASYHQIGADSQRMASHNPNFQQIPDKGIAAELRRYVVAAPGFVLVDADFSNIELRIVAELSGDKYLLDAFKSGGDIHAAMAVIMFELDKNPEFVAAMKRGEDVKEWTDSRDAIVGGQTLPHTSYRKSAKTINYMLLYGAGVQRLASKLHITMKQAGSLRGIYYETFATAIAYLDSQKKLLDQALSRGQSRVSVRTRAGWVRWFDIPPVPKSPVTTNANGSKQLTVEATNKYQADMDEYRGKLASIRRALANTPVQGLSAAITKEAAAQLYEAIGYHPDMHLVAIIHDEMLLEVRPELVREAKTVLRTAMMNAMRRYLHVVSLGEVEPAENSYWKH